MKKKLFISTILLMLSFAMYSYDKAGTTNDTFDDQPVHQLKQNEIKIYGEIENPGATVDLSKLPKHSVLAKEAVLKDGEKTYIGSYNYTGYSLYDIVNNVKLKKTSGFYPALDLYLKIENSKGDSVIVSWGEIYYTTDRNRNIIATEVSQILAHSKDKPGKPRPIPTNMKLVMGKDFLTERNITSPTKITILSIKAPGAEKKDKTAKRYSDNLKISEAGNTLVDLTEFPEEYKDLTYPCIFFGHGRAFHRIDDFNGVPIKFILKKYFPVTKENMMNGLFSVIAKDGFRCTYSYSEILNNNNHEDVLLLNRTDRKDGKFRLFPGGDFYADRAVKCLAEIKFTNLK